MKTPRISLATLSVVVAVLALDFALVRWLFDGEPGFSKTFLVGFLPTGNALILGLYRILRIKKRRHPFTVGFEIAGWLATFAFAAACAMAPDAVMGRFVDFAEMANLALGVTAHRLLHGNTTSGAAFQVGIVMAFFTPPTLLVALAGGVVGRLVGRGSAPTA